MERFPNRYASSISFGLDCTIQECSEQESRKRYEIHYKKYEDFYRKSRDERLHYEYWETDDCDTWVDVNYPVMFSDDPLYPGGFNVWDNRKGFVHVIYNHKLPDAVKSWGGGGFYTGIETRETIVDGREYGKYAYFIVAWNVWLDHVKEKFF